MPQLRMIDGVEISSEEKVKAENLHGYDLQDREIIFKSLLPDEKFVDRRIGCIEDVPVESDSDCGPKESGGEVLSQEGIMSSGMNSAKANSNMAKQYVGELISRVDFGNKNSNSPRFIQST
jgi:hypothetical protein